MAYDIPAFTGTITTISGTQGHPTRDCSMGYIKDGGKWCPYCKAEGRYRWLEPHRYCPEHTTHEDLIEKRAWERECMESWGIK